MVRPADRCFFFFVLNVIFSECRGLLSPTSSEIIISRFFWRGFCCMPSSWDSFTGTYRSFIVVSRQYEPRDRLLLCRGASGSVMVTHTRIAWMLHLAY